MSMIKPIPVESEIYHSDVKLVLPNDRENFDNVDINAEVRQRLLTDLYDKLSVAEAESAAADPGVSHEDLMNEIRKMIDERGL
ncbi:MAG: hypothetical protein M0T74_00920 [Desulfitobacterium hafniense]|nr:hypothetical protein [Desulfitobacterium hafniense]